MRILIVSGQWFPDFTGGSARVATEIAHGLAGRGHEIVAMVPRSPGSPDLEEPLPNLTVRRVLPRTRLPVTFTDLFWTWRDARRIRREHFDVVLAHQTPNAIGVRLARVRAPLVFVFHASPARELRYLRSRLRLGLRKLATYPLELPLVISERVVVRRLAAEIVALSEFSRSLLKADHRGEGERARIVPGPIDTGRFAPADGRQSAKARLGLRGDATLLVTVRRLEPRMGLEHLLEAMRLLLHSGELDLAVVGSGTLEADLRQLAVEIGVEEHVRFVGRVADSDLPDWYRAADVFVLPTAAYEGFGMVTGEALACGTPVVGTPVGATRELLEPLEPRLMAVAADADALAAAVRQALALTGPDLSRRCREHACERYALSVATEAWEGVLSAASLSPSRRAPSAGADLARDGA